MNIIFSGAFKKRFSKLPVKIQAKFEGRIELFRLNPFDRVLENHPLKGNLHEYRSFSVTGDYRVKFRIVDAESIKLVDIGRHPQVYGK